MGEQALIFWIGVGLAVYLFSIIVGCSVAVWKWTRRKERGEPYE